MIVENHTTQKLMVNGRNIFIESYGQEKNPAVVFLHHGLGSTYSWQSHVHVFAEAGYFVIAYDRWGYGKSDARQSVITSDFGEDLADLLSLIKIFHLHSTALIGHSDGGTLALYYAAQNPDQVRCLVTIAAHIYVEECMKPSIMKVRQTYFENAWFRQALTGLHGEKTSSVVSNWYDGWLNIKNLDWDMRPIISQISCPTLVVQGNDDEHGSPQQARDIATAIIGTELWMPSGGGHLFPQDHPELFNPKVLSFLNEHYVQ